MAKAKRPPRPTPWCCRLFGHRWRVTIKITATSRRWKLPRRCKRCGLGDYEGKAR